MTVIAGLPMDESEQDRIPRAILDPRKCRPKQRFFRIITIILIKYGRCPIVSLSLISTAQNINSFLSRK